MDTPSRRPSGHSQYVPKYYQTNDSNIWGMKWQFPCAHITTFRATCTGLFLKSSSTYSATRGAAIRSGSEPPMSRQASLRMGQNTMAESTRYQASLAWYQSFLPPSTLQSISQLHESFALFFICCPQTQNTHLVFTGFYMGLSNLQGLHEKERKKNKRMKTLSLANAHENIIQAAIKTTE